MQLRRKLNSFQIQDFKINKLTKISKNNNKIHYNKWKKNIRINTKNNIKNRNNYNNYQIKKNANNKNNNNKVKKIIKKEKRVI